MKALLASNPSSLRCPLPARHLTSLGACPGLCFPLPSLPTPSGGGLVNSNSTGNYPLLLLGAEVRRPPYWSLEIEDSVHTSCRTAKLSAMQSCNPIFKLLMKLMIYLYFDLSPGVGAVCMSGNGWEKVRWKSRLLLNCHYLPPLPSLVLRPCPCTAYHMLRYQFTLSVEVLLAGWAEYAGLEGSLVHARNLRTGF